jgi:hypothetical protein
MAVNPTAGTPLVRPIRPDRLQRGGPQLRTRLAALGISGKEATDLSRGLLATARILRTYLDGVRSLLRARTHEAAGRALESLHKATTQLHERIESMAPLLERAREQEGNGQDPDGLVDVWFRAGGPRELTSEGRLRNALTEHLASLGRVRKSDLAHLACLWSDSQRYHGALRGLLNAPPTRPNEVAGFLEAVVGTLADHVLPVDVVGLTGDPGLLKGIPAMMDRLGAPPARRVR